MFWPRRPSVVKASVSTPIRSSRPHRGTAFRPQLEILEDRLLLTTLTVLNNSDTGVSGDGSLRGEILAAGSGDTINFAASLNGATISLAPANGTLSLSTNLTIDASALSSGVTVAGNHTFGIFSVASGTSVSFVGLTIAQGQALVGGGIANAGTLNVQNCTLTGNIASGKTAGGYANTYGGGIYNSSVLYMSNTALISNQATTSGTYIAEGGALVNRGDMYLANCTLTGNTAAGGGNSYGGAIANSKGRYLYLAHSTLTGNKAGSATSGNSYGGAIYNHGYLFLTSSTLTGNSAVGGNSTGTGNKALGGAVYNSNYLLAASCTFSSNQSQGGASTGGGTGGAASGGAIHTSSKGALNLTASVINGNSATGGSGLKGGDGSGGGIFGAFKSTIARSTLSGNTAQGGAGTNTGGNAFGGGLYSAMYYSAIVGSTLSGNSAIGGAGPVGGKGFGGGAYFYTYSGSKTPYGAYMLNSTVYGNTASGGNGSVTNGPGTGGGIQAAASAGVTVTNCTIAGNTATAGAGTGSAGQGIGGGFNVANGKLTLKNTIVALDTAATNPDLSGAVTADHSLIGNTTGATITGSNNQLNANPMLGPLQSNGGPTQTLDLLAGSPAIGNGNTAYVVGNAPYLDQNLNNRVIQTGSVITSVDIGAVQYLPGGVNVPYVLPLNTQYYDPLEIAAGYGVNQISLPLGQLAGQGQTIAIMEPLQLPSFVPSTDPNYQFSDLAIFDRAFGLPDPPSFQIVGFDATLNGGQGGSVLPSQSPRIYSYPSSSGEYALDIEWAHAMAPAANIIVVEFNSSLGFTQEMQAEAFAATLPGVSVITTSYGFYENQVPQPESQFDVIFQNGPGAIYNPQTNQFTAGPAVTNTFNFSTGQTTQTAGHNPVTYVFTAGDDRTINPIKGSAHYVEYPSSSPYVVAVGATNLHLTSSTTAAAAYGSEAGWYTGDGGPSMQQGAYGPEPQLPYQQQAVQQANTYTTNLNTTTGSNYSLLPLNARITPDLAIVGAPYSEAVLDTYGTTYSSGTSPYYGASFYHSVDPWYGYDGTSIAAPKIAGILSIMNQLRANVGLPTLSGLQTLQQMYSLPSSDYNPVNGLDQTSYYTAYPDPSGHTYNTYTGLGSPIANLWVPGVAGLGISLSAPPTTPIGATFALTVTLQDLANGGATDAGYRGTVHFSSSDALAGLPANYTYTAADQGTHTFFVTLNTLGNQTVTVADTSYSLLTASASVGVLPVPTLLTLASTPANAGPGDLVTFTATVSDAVVSSLSPPTGGTVTFVIDGQVQAVVPLVNGKALFATAGLSLGRHTVSASYSGTATFLASTGTALTQTIAEPLVAVGTDAGVAAQVNVYDARTQALQFALSPFGGFTGGVRVAVGDVNGDGTPDVIVGAGPGGGPQVRVYDGVTGQPLPGRLGSFYGLAAGFTGGVFVAAGDVNGDGYADVVVGADAGGGPQVTVYSGKDGSLLTSFYGLPSGFAGGVRVAAGDVDGDGHADIIVAAGAGGGPQVTAYSGANLSILTSFYAFPSNFTGGAFVATADVSGTGKAEIIAGAGPGGLPQITVFRGTTGSILKSFYDPRQGGAANQPGVTAASGVRVGTTAVKGQVQLLATAGPGLPALVDVFSGQTLALLDSFFAFDPAFRGGAFVGG